MPDDFHHSDPLAGMAMPDYGRELFKRYHNDSDGFSTDAIVFAATNMIIRTLRETYGQRDKVIERIDDLHRRTMDAVLQHYDPTTNRRRSTVPFTQRLSVPLFIDKDKLRK